ncbi:hypothetical protein FKW77_004575 [Venturia effusa]|uniref:Heterokaryon incompatibility domain-containing protein n=1 Tax=Venturia effusa TaxID=50376 RepID=A0A517LQ34_9PEZI|nr:hypothetical protein FKW77_004575 [Venturia effusa]
MPKVPPTRKAPRSCERTEVKNRRGEAASFINEPELEHDARREAKVAPAIDLPTPDVQQGSQHVYQHLDKTSNDIRLASVERRRDGSIQCNLHTYPINEAPPFIALSYTWGLPSPVRTIVLDGEDFMVRENLHAALLMLLQKKEHRYDFPSWFPSVPMHDLDSMSKESVNPSVSDLEPFSAPEWDMMDRTSEMTAWGFFWIDAICIDQESIAERNHQVNMMRQIFARAAFVLVWLGPESADSKLAMDTLRSLYEPQASTSPRQVWADQTRKKPILSLLGRDYWKRVWIIQEIIMSRDLLFLCGAQELFWRELSSFITKLGPIYERGGAFTIIEEKRMSLHEESKGYDLDVPLHFLIPRYCRQDCTDPRDRVFGLLGLVVEGFMTTRTGQGWDRRMIVRADYSLSTADLFNLVMAYVKHWSWTGELEELNFQSVLREALLLDGG